MTMLDITERDQTEALTGYPERRATKLLRIVFRG